MLWQHMWFASFVSCELTVKVCVCVWQKTAMLVEETNNNTEICEVSKNIWARLTTLYAYFENKPVCSSFHITVLQQQNKGDKNKPKPEIKRQEFKKRLVRWGKAFWNQVFLSNPGLQVVVKLNHTHIYSVFMEFKVEALV